MSIGLGFQAAGLSGTQFNNPILNASFQFGGLSLFPDARLNQLLPGLDINTTPAVDTFSAASPFGFTGAFGIPAAPATPQLRPPVQPQNAGDRLAQANAEYLKNNPDVALAVEKGLMKSGYDHYIRHGVLEGRDFASTPGSEQFEKLAKDEAQYLNDNPDVAAAVARGDFKFGQEHYKQYGQKEGRAFGGKPFVLPQQADAAYLQANPDVAAAVSRGEFASGSEHYMKFGVKEGRDYGSSLAASNTETSAKAETAYLQANPDVAAAVAKGDFSSGLEHYLKFGQNEGRAYAPPQA